jgi:hypothetical protein
MSAPQNPAGQALRAAALCALGILLAAFAQAQTAGSERAFPQSKANIEKALKTMQASLSGRLPVLDGFAEAGEHPLDRYQKGFYQATIDVRPSPKGGSIVRVRLKVTAWYSDSAASGSGYKLLESNGRLEADLLDQLQDQLARVAPETGGGAVSASSSASAPKEPSAPAKNAEPSSSEPAISAPSPKFPDTGGTFSTSLTQGLSAAAAEKTPGSLTPEKSDNSLRAEADNLEEVLKNTAHPKNLIAVKKSGTPVVATPSLTAKAQFLASMHDEFELLDFNADWVHVRISGLSRGWIWRNSVEMPDGIPDTDAPAASALAPAADLFHVIREETAPFPGDWEPLRNKNVKIISVQKVEEGAKDAGSKERLEYAKFLFEKNYTELATKKETQGLVVIFDSADGGMIAATMAALQQWKAGTLSDAALWHKCFFDPPETFDSAAPSGSQ